MTIDNFICSIENSQFTFAGHDIKLLDSDFVRIIYLGGQLLIPYKDFVNSALYPNTLQPEIRKLEITKLKLVQDDNRDYELVLDTTEQLNSYKDTSIKAGMKFN